MKSCACGASGSTACPAPRRPRSTAILSFSSAAKDLACRPRRPGARGRAEMLHNDTATQETPAGEPARTRAMEGRLPQQKQQLEGRSGEVGGGRPACDRPSPASPNLPPSPAGGGGGGGGP